MQIGTSTVSLTAPSMSLSSSDSSTSGMPALTSSMSAPASTWARASSPTVDRSPLRSSSAKRLRPVGLIRSPITQNGWSWPMTTVLPRDCRVVCMFPFGGRSQVEALAELGDRVVLAERDEVQARDPGQRQRVRGLLGGEVEQCGALVVGGLDALDRLGRHIDPEDLLVHEAQAAGRAEQRDRRQQCGGHAGGGGLRDELLEQRRLEADLQLQEARARLRLGQRALDAVLDRRGRRALDGADEELRRGLERAARAVMALRERRGEGDEVGPAELEDRRAVGLVAGLDGVAGQAQDVLDAVHRGTDDVGLQRERVAV